MNLEGVVCVSCDKPLRANGSALVCDACQAKTPVRDGIPCFYQLDPDAAPFREEYFDFWFKFETTHFWHVGRREIIYRFTEPFLKQASGSPGGIRGIEIGIGNGNVTKGFVDKGVRMEGADLFESSLRYCRKRMDIPLFQADLLKLPFKQRYDFIGIYDILEHVEDDPAAIRNLYNALKPGGVLSVTVPACMSLWSPFDELDHKRRYSRRELKEKLEAAGFKVKRISFFMFFLFPIIYLVRRTQTYGKDTKLENIKELRSIPVINEVFLAVLRLEKFLLRWLDFPIGSSLIAIAQKPGA